MVIAWGDAPAVLGALARFPPLLVVPVVLLTVWNYVLRWLRWNYYLRVLGVNGVDRASSALVFLSGFAMGLTPGKSGELTKSYWLREIAGAEQAPLARTAPIVFAERLVDGIAMLLLAASGLITFRFGGLALLVVAALAAAAVGLIQARPLVPPAFRAQASPVTLAIGKQAYYTQIDLDQPKAYAYAKEIMTMNSMAADAQEGISAFLEKRPACWTGK